MPMTRRMMLKRGASASALLITTGAAKAAPRTHLVRIKDFAFDPEILEISAGDTVEWQNLDGFLHTATSDVPGLFDTKIIRTGRTSAHEFITISEQGEIPYHCEVYPMMKARIIVTS